MADLKISQLTALLGSAAADTDVVPVVDVSATTTKKISLSELVEYIVANGVFTGSLGTPIDETIVDAKGDLIVATADNTPARLAVGGTNGHVLTVDSATATGVKWAAIPTQTPNWEDDQAILSGLIFG